MPQTVKTSFFISATSRKNMTVTFWEKYRGKQNIEVSMLNPQGRPVTYKLVYNHIDQDWDNDARLNENVLISVAVAGGFLPEGMEEI